MTTRIPLVLPVLAISALAALLAPAAAEAELTWQKSHPLSVGGQNAEQPALAMNERGDASAVWRRFDGATSNWRIQASFRPSGGNFDVAQVTEWISEGRGGAEAGGDARSPQVAIDEQGNALAVWQRDEPRPACCAGATRIQAAFRPAGGTFGAPQTISEAGVVDGPPQVAFDQQGNALVIWDGFGPTEHFVHRIQAAFRPVGGSFGSLETLCENCGVSPRVAIDRLGNALAIWQGHDGISTYVTAADRPAGGAFGEPEWISDRNVAEPDLALDPRGNALAIWQNTHVADGGIRAAFRQAGQDFGDEQTLAEVEFATSEQTFRPQVAFDPQGNAVAVWVRRVGAADTRVEAAFRPTGLSFGAAESISERGVRLSSEVAMDGGGNALAVWSRDTGSDAQLEAAFRPASGSFVAQDPISDPGEEAASPQVAMDGPGTAVAVWEGFDAESGSTVIRARLGIPPGVTPPPPPPPPPPPEPSAIKLAKKLEPSGPAVVTATVSGAVDRLEWDLPGSKQAIVGGVVNGALQRSARFRPRPDSKFTVKVRAVGPGGTQTFSRGFKAPRARAGDHVDRVERALGPAPDVYAVGNEDALVARSLPRRARRASCAATTVYSGSLQLGGCMRPLDELGDVPGPERGIVDALARGLGLQRENGDVIRTALELSDGYMARGATTINGTWPVVPRGGASVLAYPQADALSSSDAGLRIGGHEFGQQRGFLLDLDARGGKIPLESLPRPPQLPSIAGFRLVGDFDAVLEGNEARIAAHLQLPGWIKRAGVDVQSRVNLRATPDSLIVDDLTIGPINANIGGLGIDRFQLAYKRVGNEWQGQGRACLIGGACLDMVPPNGQIKIKDGRLDFAGASLQFPTPGIPLFAGVNLERIGFGFGLDPTRFTGNARLSLAQILVVDGRIVLAFPSAATPFYLRPDEVGGGFPPQFYNRPYTGTTIGISAEAALRLPAIGEVPLASAYVLYEFPGYLALGGRFGTDLAGIVSVGGIVSGEFNLGEGLFNLHGNVEACVVSVVCGGAIVNVSRGRGGTGGAGACIKLGPLQVGGGVQWLRVSEPFIWPLDGCKWSRFAADVRSAGEAGARAERLATAAVGSPHLVRIRPGEPSRAVQLDGDGAAPLVRVRGPSGELLEGSSEVGLTTSADGSIRIMRYEGEQAQFTVVGLQDPRPGTYEIEPIEGSPAVATISEASDPPDAKASANVTGRGKARELTYDVRRRAAQRVTFLELRAGGTAKEIGTVSGGGRGKLRFVPAPGRGKSRIAAQFELNGLPAERRVLARFAPPSPRLAKPKGLRAEHNGKRLRVDWKRVGGAGRYELAVTTSTGAQRFVKSAKTSALVKRVPRSSAGKVSIRAVDRLREGAPTRARFQRTAPRRTSLRALPRCRVKERVVCSRR